MAWMSYNRDNFPDITKTREIAEKLLRLHKDDPEVFDKGFLSYCLKELLESGSVFISEKAFKKLEDYLKEDNANQEKLSKVEKIYSKFSQTSCISDRALIERDLDGIRKDVGVVWEHMIPVNILIDILLKTDSDKLQSTLEIIREKAHVAIISTDEDKGLNKDGFKQKMPGEDQSIEAIISAPDARYKQKQIMLKK